MAVWPSGRLAFWPCGNRLLQRLMSPSPKSQVMFASAFSWIVDFFRIFGIQRFYATATLLNMSLSPATASVTYTLQAYRLATGARRPLLMTTGASTTTGWFFSTLVVLKAIQRMGDEYPKHRPDKHVRKGQCAAVWQINLYYVIFSTYQYT